MVRKTRARLLFLPPYSLDLNPIEQIFAKLKHFMRNVGDPRSDGASHDHAGW